MSEYSELKRLAKEYISLMNNDDDDVQICMEAKHEYELASDAEVILALIAENEALREEVKELHRKIGGSATHPNKGHGHVFPRADGIRMRCGGPGMCKECSADLLRKEKKD